MCTQVSVWLLCLLIVATVAGCTHIRAPLNGPAPVTQSNVVAAEQSPRRTEGDGHPAENVMRQVPHYDERISRLVGKYSTPERWLTRVPFSVPSEECARVIPTQLADTESCEVASAAAGTAVAVVVHGDCTGDFCGKKLWVIVPGVRAVEVREPKRHNVVAGIGLDVTMNHLNAVVDLGIDVTHTDDEGEGTHGGTLLYQLKAGTGRLLTPRMACIVSGRPDELLCRDEQANVYSVNAVTGGESLVVRVFAPGMEVAARTQDNPGPGEPLIFNGKLMAGMTGKFPGVCPDEFACDVEVQARWPPENTPVEAKPTLVKWECHGNECRRVAPSPLP